ncbi:MAG: DNA translocase FtsK, partial [Clostridiales bacterium]|nr:DNA translocase FtsK [Clostridiales bacterium]
LLLFCFNILPPGKRDAYKPIGSIRHDFSRDPLREAQKVADGVGQPLYVSEIAERPKAPEAKYFSQMDDRYYAPESEPSGLTSFNNESRRGAAGLGQQPYQAAPAAPSGDYQTARDMLYGGAKKTELSAAQAVAAQSYTKPADYTIPNIFSGGGFGAPPPTGTRPSNFSYQNTLPQPDSQGYFAANNNSVPKTGTAAQQDSGNNFKRPPMVVHEPPVNPVFQENYIPPQIVNGDTRSEEIRKQKERDAAQKRDGGTPVIETREESGPRIINGEDESRRIRAEKQRETEKNRPAPAVQAEPVPFAVAQFEPPHIPKTNIPNFMEYRARMQNGADLNDFVRETSGTTVTPSDASASFDYKAYYDEKNRTAKPVFTPAPKKPEPMRTEEYYEPEPVISQTDFVCEQTERPEPTERVADYTGYYTTLPPETPASNSFLNNVDQIEAALNPKPKAAKRSDAVPGQVNIEDYMAAKANPAVRPVRIFAKYNLPPIELLDESTTFTGEPDEECMEKASILEQTLAEFKSPAKVVAITKGPAVTRYELQMDTGTPVKSVSRYSSDLAYNLAARGKIRIVAPIPGKQAVGVEVPNNKVDIVSLRSVIDSDEFYKETSPLTVAIGKNIVGKPIVGDITDYTHLLVAGTTKSGKSSCLNSLIISLIYKTSPEDLRLILVDPKLVEFTNYQGLPHMMFEKAITTVDAAIKVFQWATEETDNRYELFAKYRVRDIKSYNNLDMVRDKETNKLPYIVIIVDEVAELMQQGKKDIEESIMKLSAKARAAGIHLVLATQRPSVDVITGVIKANLPSRIAFAVSSYVDSKVILDDGGAENLLGRGDMLYSPSGIYPERIQGAYVTTEEINAVVEYATNNNEAYFETELERKIYSTKEDVIQPEISADGAEALDPLFKPALKLFIEKGEASINFIQRRFGAGYNRAARIIDQMELKGYISAKDETNKRVILLT